MGQTGAACLLGPSPLQPHALSMIGCCTCGAHRPHAQTRVCLETSKLAAHSVTHMHMCVGAGQEAHRHGNVKVGFQSVI